MDDPSEPKPKQNSGAKNRKIAKDKRKAELLVKPSSESRYADLGTPSLDDPTVALIYAQNCMVIALGDIVKSPDLTEPQRWKLIAQFGGQIGITHAKALLQSKIDKATKRLSAMDEINGGPKSLRGIAKPATSRDASGNVPPEPLSGYLSSPSEEEDEGDPPMGGGPVGSCSEEVP